MNRSQEIMDRINEKKKEAISLKQIPLRLPEPLLNDYKKMLEDLGGPSINEFTVTMIELQVEEYKKSEK